MKPYHLVQQYYQTIWNDKNIENINILLSDDIEHKTYRDYKSIVITDKTQVIDCYRQLEKISKRLDTEILFFSIKNLSNNTFEIDYNINCEMENVKYTCKITDVIHITNKDDKCLIDKLHMYCHYKIAI
jgi:hypothetical protein